MRTLTVNDYAKQIQLHQPFESTTLPQCSEAELVDVLLETLSSTLRGFGLQDTTPLIAAEKRSLLDAAITVLPPHGLNEKGKAALDALLTKEREKRDITYANALRPFVTIGKTNIVLWRGDITTLNVDAILNAANSQLLGCFLPHHKCIDNAIHNRAGVQLREDCDAIIRLQGAEEPTAAAKITRGYNLPSRYVIHSVGPIVQGAVSEESERLLAQAYTKVLSATQSVDNIRSLALCSLSTGVFGYPIEKATPVALKTVAEWLNRNPDALDVVVFNVFSERDYDVYQSELEEFVCNN
ncbi:protein-ADP-ribose hydrolase [Enterovibrio coralii]|uniref:Protein-ADP-ribose hydrolase n=1 Tax=Enterovibrio coralii TaxID=294935 RepID=A0A135I5T8_9GAMM|nr:protein-ADP-ribose hydrolase [Enterovibrio coralii]KXF80767.1 hypothetical protein ATN88_15915 [Enterovibrio coralii]